MTLTSIGDMARHFSSLRQNTAIKTRMDILTREMASGRVADLATHLGGNSARLLSIKGSIDIASGFASANRTLGQTLSTMQVALGTVEAERVSLSSTLMTVSSQSSQQELKATQGAAEGAFGSVVRSLNARFGDASLFSGTAADRAPLAAPEAMLASIRAALVGATSVNDVKTVLDDWFDAPAGGFATTGYLGDSGALPVRRINSETAITIDARADDPALRAVMKATAMAAVAGDPGLGFSTGDQALLMQEARSSLLAAGDNLIALQAGLGHLEERVDRTTALQTAQQAALGIMHIDLVSADPFATASQLQAVQQQLETHYTLTARLSGLSLVNYLR